MLNGTALSKLQAAEGIFTKAVKLYEATIKAAGKEVVAATDEIVKARDKCTNAEYILDRATVAKKKVEAILGE